MTRPVVRPPWWRTASVVSMSSAVPPSGTRSVWISRAIPAAPVVATASVARVRPPATASRIARETAVGMGSVVHWRAAIPVRAIAVHAMEAAVCLEPVLVVRIRRWPRASVPPIRAAAQERGRRHVRQRRMRADRVEAIVVLPTSLRVVTTPRSKAACVGSIPSAASSPGMVAAR